MKKESELSEFELEAIDGYLSNIRRGREEVGIINRQRGKEVKRDPQAIALGEKFVKIPFLLHGNEQDTYSILYAKHIAGVVVPNGQQRWRNTEWLDQIGYNLNSVGEQPPRNGPTLWQQVKIDIPGLLTDSEIEWLIQHDQEGSWASWLHFSLFIDLKSAIVAQVNASIHAWK